ncbi:hypothetical protein H8959_016957, partial [Pygathrix nigripes]
PGVASHTSHSESKCSLPGRHQCFCLFVRTPRPPRPLSGVAYDESEQMAISAEATVHWTYSFQFRTHQ